MIAILKTDSLEVSFISIIDCGGGRANLQNADFFQNLNAADHPRILNILNVLMH
jgi:hypothetical protein